MTEKQMTSKNMLRVNLLAACVLFWCTVYSQNVTLRGTVKDANNLPLIGVNVVEKGTTNGTVTDINGNYTLSAPSGATIVFSYIGYNSQEIVWDGQSILNVVLEEDQQLLEEVVVVGYGTQKKATITGAISSTSGEELMKIPTVNFSNSFAGKLPGLTVVTRTGEPGSDNSTFRIRGSNTLGNNNPLIVIDGIANRDMNRLNAADIESVTVLKDASAAIYGAQAANGVILITTKRGLDGKPRITVNLNQGWSMPTVLPEMADAATYAQMVNEINYYDGNPPRYSDDDIQKYKDGSDPWRYPNTDWYAETMKSSALQQYANVELRGGSEWLKYFVSVGANFQDGIYKNSATKYDQANFRSNLDGKITDNINLSFDISGRQENRNYPTRSASSIFSMLMRGYPNTHAYWPNGLNGPDIALGNNPVVITTNQSGYDKRINYVFESVAKLNINIPWIEGLSFTSNVSFDKNILNRKLWEIPWTLYSWDGQSVDDNNIPVLNPVKKGFESPQLTQRMEDGKRITINGLLNYEKSIAEKHRMNILVGSERISGDNMNFWAFRKHFVSTALDQLFAGGELEKDNNGSASLNARLNYFGRVNYDYLSKYLIEFVWRYDGSYIFPKDKRFGFFPGVSLGWVASDENFWKNSLSPINHFKLRASWGQTGNDRIDEYQYLSSYGFGSLNYVFGDEEKTLTELRIPNPDVTWEVANQFNIGFDGILLNNKLSISADYFYNFRSNILWLRNASVPESTGLTLPRENIGEVINQGFDFMVSYENKLGEFRYKASLNGGYSKNHIQFWDETPGVPEYQKSTGRPMNAALNYVAIGIFKDQADIDAYPHWQGARPGDVKFKDVNEDGVIDGLDRVRADKTDLPTFVGGLNLNFSWKNFYSSLFFQWATGAERYRYYEMQGEAGNFLANDAKGRWTEDNPSATKARTWNRYFGYWREQRNTYWLESADYLRLKSLELGYNLSTFNFVKQIRVEDIRIYLSGFNLLTFSKMRDFDPESTSSTSYPLNRVYNIGLSVTF
ncbi:TonB-linked outer membrane protein, SusC/RagA family [Porphyromonadaceae bacterium NLAE-zl-C104]|nr:TonB-linked outer membrane protein, SusC/RagA family [Porphyromonadaceae bacterium NLAE-zl-C104]